MQLIYCQYRHVFRQECVTQPPPSPTSQEICRRLQERRFCKQSKELFWNLLFNIVQCMHSTSVLVVKKCYLKLFTTKKRTKVVVKSKRRWESGPAILESLQIQSARDLLPPITFSSSLVNFRTLLLSI